MWAPTKEELSRIIKNHKHWIYEDCDGWESMRADLREVDLYGADLRGANLREAKLNEAKLYRADLREVNLRGAKLYRADLREVNLRGADLSGANLYRADLSGANLREVDLYGADLREVNLREAKLYRADLRGANLREADLSGANLYRADLSGADLREVDLREANLNEAKLYRADLREAKNIPFIPIACPDSGAFIGWKKAISSKGKHPDWRIIKLEIPSDARRSSATGRKCRCDKAVVLAIESLDGTVIYDHAYSDHDPDFEYKVGETVSVDNFDEDRFNECSTGIHFFINRQEAVDYML